MLARVLEDESAMIVRRTMPSIMGDCSFTLYGLLRSMLARVLDDEMRLRHRMPSKMVRGLGN